MTTSHGDSIRLKKFWSALVLILLFAAVPVVRARVPGSSSDLPATTVGEARAIRAFDLAKGFGEPGVYAFLRTMPKGADLHMHLSGAIYAETFLKDAVADGLCVDPTKLSFAKSSGVSKETPPALKCTEGAVAEAGVFANQKLYDALIDAFSMRSFVPTPGVSGAESVLLRSVSPVTVAVPAFATFTVGTSPVAAGVPGAVGAASTNPACLVAFVSKGVKPLPPN